MFVSKWIDIKDEEPKDGQECLIYTKQNKISKAKWRSGEGYSDKTQHGWWQGSGGSHNAALYWMPMPSAPGHCYEYNFEDDFFGAVINCAVRYACGRQSYMPSLVIGEVRKMIPMLNDKTIGCMERDIREAEKFGGYGDEKIDKPGWLAFLKELQDEMDRRKINRWT
jgi:hypothetical protein